MKIARAVGVDVWCWVFFWPLEGRGEGAACRSWWCFFFRYCFTFFAIPGLLGLAYKTAVVKMV